MIYKECGLGAVRSGLLGWFCIDRGVRDLIGGMLAIGCIALIFTNLFDSSILTCNTSI